MDIAELQDAESFEILGQPGDRQVHFANPEIGALHQGAVAHGRDNGLPSERCRPH